jgi:hypothetical protein
MRKNRSANFQEAEPHKKVLEGSGKACAGSIISGMDNVINFGIDKTIEHRVILD